MTGTSFSENLKKENMNQGFYIYLSCPLRYHSFIKLLFRNQKLKEYCIHEHFLGKILENKLHPTKRQIGKF
jgi:hypothetical protein